MSPGWIVTFASMLALGIIFGASYSFGAFFAVLSESFQAQRADVSLMFGLAGFLYFVAGAAGGIAAVRLGPRLVASCGMVFIGLGAIAASRAETLEEIYWTYGLGIGLGIALVYTPVMGAVPPWFTKHRSLASGVASAGIGLGTLIIPPLVSLGIRHLAWRETMFYLGLGAMLLGLIATSQIRMPHQAGAQQQRLSGMSLREAVSSKPFWLLFGICTIAGPSLFFPFAHLIQFARDQGVGEVQAVSTIGFIGIGSIAGRFLIGFFCRPLWTSCHHGRFKCNLGLLLTYLVARSRMAWAHAIRLMLRSFIWLSRCPFPAYLYGFFWRSRGHWNPWFGL